LAFDEIFYKYPYGINAYQGKACPVLCGNSKSINRQEVVPSLFDVFAGNSLYLLSQTFMEVDTGH
jgi:hypothetical protein